MKGKLSVCSCFLAEVCFLAFQTLVRKNKTLKFVPLAFTQDCRERNEKDSFPRERRRPCRQARLPPCGTMGATSQSRARRAGGRTARSDCERSGWRHMGPSGRRGWRVGTLAAGGPSSGKSEEWAQASPCRPARPTSGKPRQCPAAVIGVPLVATNNPKGMLQNTLAKRGAGRLPLT